MAGLLPGEPEDCTELEDVDHWIAVYAEVRQTITDIGTSTPSPELLARVVAADGRLRYWLRRRQELQNGFGVAAGGGS